MSLLKVNSVQDLGADPVVTNGVVERLALPSGSVLQVVQATTTTSTTTTSSSYVNTSLSASITPSSTSSKVLILCSISSLKTTNQDALANIRIFRGNVSGPALGTDVMATTYFAGVAGTIAVEAQASPMFLDSPATTSAQTYTVGLKSANAISVQIYQQQTMILMEIAG